MTGKTAQLPKIAVPDRSYEPSERNGPCKHIRQEPWRLTHLATPLNFRPSKQRTNLQFAPSASCTLPAAPASFSYPHATAASTANAMEATPSSGEEHSTQRAAAAPTNRPAAAWTSSTRGFASSIQTTVPRYRETTTTTPPLVPYRRPNSFLDASKSAVARRTQSSAARRLLLHPTAIQQTLHYKCRTRTRAPGLEDRGEAKGSWRRRTSISIVVLDAKDRKPHEGDRGHPSQPKPARPPPRPGWAGLGCLWRPRPKLAVTSSLDGGAFKFSSSHVSWPEDRSSPACVRSTPEPRFQDQARARFGFVRTLGTTTTTTLHQLVRRFRVHGN